MSVAGAQRRTTARVPVVTLVDRLGLGGGAERLATLIAMRLDSERFDSTLCISRWPPPVGSDEEVQRALDQLARDGVRLLPLGRRRKADVWVWWRLERFLRREGVQVLHAHKFGSNLWGTLIAGVAQVPVVLAHEHSWSYSGKPLRRLLDREVIARRADRVIAVSREDQRRMIEIERIDPARTLFIPNGVLASTPARRADVRSELGLGGNDQVIGIVGTLRPVKAHEVLLQALPPLVREWPRLRLLIVGEGPRRAELERAARQLEVAEAVRFLGHRDDVPALLRALDVAVCCSDLEGSPLAIMEYMEAGLPVVATAVGGLPDLIESGVHGLLVQPRDPAALASALAELLGDPARARAMGEQAHERWHSEFDLEIIVRRLEDLYLELLREKALRGRTRRAGASGTLADRA